MADPTVVTTSEKPGMLEGLRGRRAAGIKEREADAAEYKWRKFQANAELSPSEQLVDESPIVPVDLPSPPGAILPTGFDKSKPTEFSVREKGLPGLLNTFNPVTPSKTVTVGPAVAAPEAVKETGEKARPSFATRMANTPIPDTNDAALLGTSGGQSDVAAVPMAVGGGYTAKQATFAPEFTEAETKIREGAEGVQKAYDEYRKDPRTAEAAAANTKRLTDATTAEELRAGRLATLGGNQKALNDDIAGKTADFKVDPERLYGQGAERAGKTFGLALANVFSNVGEAMQGKAGTNAILGLIRDRVAQDIALQEADYKRMLQGYEVQRNGLMDAIAMVGTERGGAEALAKQQALGYLDTTERLMQGVKDAKQRQAGLAAVAEGKLALGKERQATEKANVTEVNEARKTGATVAANVSIANTKNLTDIAVEKLRADAAREQRVALARITMGQTSPEDNATIKDALKEDAVKGMGQRRAALDKLAEVTKDPEVAKALGTYSGLWLSSYNPDDSTGLFARGSTNALDKLARGNLTPAQNLALEVLRMYNAITLTAKGGKALTTNEINLLKFGFAGDAAQMAANLRLVRDEIHNEKDAVAKRYFNILGAHGRRALGASLNLLDPDEDVTASGLQAQPGDAP